MILDGNLLSTRGSCVPIHIILRNTNNRTSRSFEYLAASTSGYTPSPGEKSFTSALMWALEKLAAPESSTSSSLPMFTTSKLAKVVREAPSFPKEQHPSLTTRDPDAYRHIVLAPLPREGDPAALPSVHEDDEDEHFRPQFLSLTFHFLSDQDEEDLQKLASNLRQFKLQHKDLRGVQLGGIWSGVGGTRPPPRHRFRQVVDKIMVARRPHRLSETSNTSLLSPYAGVPSLYPTQSAASATESTPLLPDSSSVTSSDTLQSETSTPFFNRLSAFLRRLRNPKTKRSERTKNLGASAKNRKTWMAGRMKKIRRILTHTFCMSG
jgi:hypothetical protein